MTRALAPLPPVQVTPQTVSQLTSLAVLGIDPRRFLEVVVPRCRGVAHVGRLRVAPVDEAMRVLRDMAPAEEDASAPAPSTDADDDEFTSVEDFLRSLGPETYERGKRGQKILDGVAARHAADPTQPSVEQHMKAQHDANEVRYRAARREELKRAREKRDNEA